MFVVHFKPVAVEVVFTPAGVFLYFNNYLLPVEQWGLYKLNRQELEQLAAARPLPLQIRTRALALDLAAGIRSALNVKDPAKLKPSEELLAKAAKACASIVREKTGAAFDFSPESLDACSEIVAKFDSEYLDRYALLGLGAYYGETFRRAAGAEWRLKGLPFGDWLPASTSAGNALVEVVLPFSDTCQTILHSEEARLCDSSGLKRRLQGKRLLLVYPPGHAQEAVEEATGEDYRGMERCLDEGDVAGAAQKLTALLTKNPQNADLASKAIGICQSLAKPELALELAHKAIAGGNEVPAILLLAGDGLLAAWPPKFLRHRSPTSSPPA